MSKRKMKTVLSQMGKHQRNLERRLITAADSNTELLCENQHLTAKMWHQDYCIEKQKQEIAALQASCRAWREQTVKLLDANNGHFYQMENMEEDMKKVLDESERLVRENLALNNQIWKLKSDLEQSHIEFAELHRAYTDRFGSEECKVIIQQH